MIKPPANRGALAMTLGDPAGIGPELALLAWLRRTEHETPYFVIGDPDHLAMVAASLGFEVPITCIEPSRATAQFPLSLPVVPLGQRVNARPGICSPDNALATLTSIERAVACVRAGEADAIVTNPIAKQALYAAGFKHPGHTEFLGELAFRYWGARTRPVMMIWSPELAVVPVTVHIALSHVRTVLSRELIVATAKITARDLHRRFGIDEPRLAVTGLNPHAGEGGAMGREELDLIAPAISDLRAAGLVVSGPHPADTVFHPAARSRYDAVLAMYHDQALIPIKTIAFDTAVNVTLGLPFVRTSPDHGTAFDIAGKGIARADSLIAALRLGRRLAMSQSARIGASLA